ncbi:MAG: Na/Pi cotransporter family protein [Chitinophagaceae bacterium]|nr:MAG: Na/Pi cotransporter family protein [Chitinophagaceae bacterium]
MFEALNVWTLLAGLGIFLLGMYMLENAIQDLSGKALRQILKKYTNNNFKAILTGALSTAILQSSSTVTLLLMAFVSAGLMTLQNGIGVIIGTNIGTTMTSWIVASVGFKLDIEAFALPFIAIGGIGLIFFGKSQRLVNISKITSGFGLLFLGLDYMKKSMDLWAASADIAQIAGMGIIALFFIGFLFTVVVQSSSAAMAIVLSSVYSEIISFEQAAVMVIGVNLGTTLKIILVSFGGSVNKKRVGFSHFSFNIFAAVIAIILLKPLVWLILDVFKLENDPVIALAVFHTLFNFLGAILFLPVIPFYKKLAVRLIKENVKKAALYLNNEVTEFPESAINTLKKETLHLFQLCMKYNLKSFNIDDSLVLSGINTKYNESFKHLKINDKYLFIKKLQTEIYTFTSSVNIELKPDESDQIRRYLQSAQLAVGSSKTIKDAGNDISEISFSDTPFLKDFYKKNRKTLMDFYIKADSIINDHFIETDSGQLISQLANLIKQIKSNEKSQLNEIIKGMNEKKILSDEVNYLLTANRNQAHSCRQFLHGISDIYLDSKESLLLDTLDSGSATESI